MKFPSSVTDAVWSPNGTRLAYIDGDGNVATAAPDGTDVLVLTKRKANAKRAHPAWNDGTSISYAERIGSGPWLIGDIGLQVATRTAAPSDWGMNQKPNAQNKAPNSAMRVNPLGSSDTSIVAFQLDDTVTEPAYITEHIDPDESGLGGYPWSFVAKGSDPAIAPDGTVAYVGQNGQLWIAGSSYSWEKKPVQITFGADHPSRPAWSPDGKRVAFGTKSDVESVAVAVPPGATSNPTQQEDPRPGVPTYQSVGTAPAVLAFDGADPATATTNVSQAKWLDYRTAQSSGSGIGTPGSAIVVLSSSNTEITAAAVAAAQRGAAFYVAPDGKVDAGLTAELKRLFAAHDKRTFRILFIADDTASTDADAAVTAAVGITPTRVKYSESESLDAAILRATVQDEPGGGQPTTPQPGYLNLVVADDDRPALLAAIGTLYASGYGAAPFQLIVTRGSTVPESAKPALNAITTQPVVAIGDHAAAALNTAWAGKPALKITKLTRPTPVELAAAVAKGVPALLQAQKADSPSVRTVAALPTPTDANWLSELAIVTSEREPVLFTNSSSNLDSASLAYVKSLTSALIHIDTVGDASALSTQLSKALNTPLPMQVLTDPKAAS